MSLNLQDDARFLGIYDSFLSHKLDKRVFSSQQFFALFLESSDYVQLCIPDHTKLLGYSLCLQFH